MCCLDVSTKKIPPLKTATMSFRKSRGYLTEFQEDLKKHPYGLSEIRHRLYR